LQRGKILSVLLAALALVALRVPGSRTPIINVDEADFVVEAGALLDGGRPTSISSRRSRR
jgi:hypothetical protein